MLRQSARGEHVVQMKLIGMLIQQRGYENGTEQKAEAAKKERLFFPQGNSRTSRNKGIFSLLWKP